jgi:hypothetical protein
MPGDKVSCCQNECTAFPNAGNVVVQGVDGNLTVESAGANVSLHLHASVERVVVETGGGDVALQLSPDITGEVVLHDCKGYSLPAHPALHSMVVGSSITVPLPLPLHAPGLGSGSRLRGEGGALLSRLQRSYDSQAISAHIEVNAGESMLLLLLQCA